MHSLILDPIPLKRCQVYSQDPLSFLTCQKESCKLKAKYILAFFVSLSIKQLQEQLDYDAKTCLSLICRMGRLSFPTGS